MGKVRGGEGESGEEEDGREDKETAVDEQDDSGKKALHRASKFCPLL